MRNCYVLRKKELPNHFQPKSFASGIVLSGKHPSFVDLFKLVSNATTNRPLVLSIKIYSKYDFFFENQVWNILKN